MEKPFAACAGEESYVFVCYAHRDAETVYADLRSLHDAGIRLWYDEGIQAGRSWRGEIAAAIAGADRFLLFLSAASLASSHCLREIHYALDRDLEIIPVFLEAQPLPPELELGFNRVQALFRNDDPRYLEHLIRALEGGVVIGPRRPKRRRGLAGALALLLAVLLAVAGGALLFAPAWQKAVVDAADRPAPRAVDPYLAGVEALDRWYEADGLARSIDRFREATELDPRFAPAFARLAEALRIRYALGGEPPLLDEAVQNAETALALAPGLAPVQVALARVRMAQGELALATLAIDRAREIDAFDPEVHEASGSLYRRLGRNEEAEAAFRRAIALAPEEPRHTSAYADFLYGQGRLADAIAQWQSAIRAEPEYYPALINLGSAFEETGRIAEAIAMYQRAIEIRPSYMAWVNLGTAYSVQERFDEATQAYRRALEFDGADWLAWGNLAFVQSWAGEPAASVEAAFDRAIELAEDARGRMPRDPWVHSDLALYYAKTQRRERALQRMEGALALAPESGEILIAAAEASELLGQRDRAVELILQALDRGAGRQQLERNPELRALALDPRLAAIP